MKRRYSIHLLYLVAFMVLSAGVLPDVVRAEVSATQTFKVQKRYLYIQPGQTVFSIVKVLYPDVKNQWPGIIRKIVRQNPHAFEGGNASRIIVGQRLSLPAVESRVKPVATKAVVHQEAGAVGKVIEARGKRFSISKDNKKRDLKLGGDVYVGDRIYTGVKGFVRLSMIDDAKIDLRCNSEMVIEDYQLMQKANKSIIFLIKGSIRKITGSIGKIAEDVYEMKTPMSTVGVRGTDYALRVLQAYGCDGSVDVNSKGLFVKVNSGGVNLNNKTGSVQLKQGEAAHVTANDKKPQSITTGEGVFDKARPVKVEEKKEDVAWWWWLLGIVALAAAI